MMFSLASKHGVALPYGSVEAVREAYAFHDLQSFLDLYYAGCAVLRDRRDFYALAMAYFARATPTASSTPSCSSTRRPTRTAGSRWRS